MVYVILILGLKRFHTLSIAVFILSYNFNRRILDLACMMETAKKERATAKRVFTMANKRFTKGISDELEPANVQEWFLKLKAARDEVLQKHAAYLCAKYPDDRR